MQDSTWEKNKPLLLNFFLIHLRTTKDVSHEIVCFATTEIAVLTYGVVEVLFMAFQ